MFELVPARFAILVLTFVVVVAKLVLLVPYLFAFAKQIYLEND